MTYDHQICIARASDVDASSERFSPGFTYFSGHRDQNVKIKFSVNDGSTNAYRHL